MIREKVILPTLMGLLVMGVAVALAFAVMGVVYLVVAFVPVWIVVIVFVLAMAWWFGWMGMEL